MLGTTGGERLGHLATETAGVIGFFALSAVGIGGVFFLLLRHYFPPKDDDDQNN